MAQAVLALPRKPASVETSSNLPCRYGQGNEGHEGDEEEGGHEGHEGDEEEGSHESHEGDEEEGCHEGHESDEEEGSHEGHEGDEEEGSHEGHEGNEEEEREQDCSGPHGVCHGAPWKQGQDRWWVDC